MTEGDPCAEYHVADGWLVTTEHADTPRQEHEPAHRVWGDMPVMTLCGQAWPSGAQLLPERPKGMRRCPTCRGLSDDIDLLNGDDDETLITASPQTAAAPPSRGSAETFGNGRPGKAANEDLWPEPSRLCAKCGRSFRPKQRKHARLCGKCRGAPIRVVSGGLPGSRR